MPVYVQKKQIEKLIQRTIIYSWLYAKEFLNCDSTLEEYMNNLKEFTKCYTKKEIKQYENI